MWSRVTSLTARQHGLVSRQQLVDLGCRTGQIDGHVHRGRLERVAHGVYGLAGRPQTPLTEVMACVLRSGEGARATGERLLAACGVRDAAELGPFTVLVPEGRRLRRADHPWRVDRYPAAGITASVQGIPSYSVPRNLVEAAVDVEDDRVAVLADGVRRVARRHLVAVERLLLRHPDHPGGRRLLLLGCLDVDAAESHAERLLEVVLRDLRPQRQVRLAPDIRVDFLLPDLRVVVEYDGSDHESGRARAADARRDARIAALGYVIVRVTRHDLREPASLLARIHLAAAAVR